MRNILGKLIVTLSGWDGRGVGVGLGEGLIGVGGQGTVPNFVR